MIGPPETLEHLDVDPVLRPLVRAMRGPRWWTVLRMRLRTTVDTGAARSVRLVGQRSWVLDEAAGLGHPRSRS